MLQTGRDPSRVVLDFESGGAPPAKDVSEDLKALERAMVRWLAESGHPQPQPDRKSVV